EVAEELGINADELFKLLHDANGSVTVSLEDIEYRVGQNGDGDYNIYEHIQDENAEDPLTLIEKADIKHQLEKAMDRLPEREKLILSLYYWEEITFKEIGKVLGISESRVSQLHSQAIIRMRAYVEGNI
ncbi:MAG: sigma-70 family RNA polymerase sigma factor, partial [Nitrospirae bacterium]|nr:sigma-70 family RNA polymerase sigma factor [Nitrospirota bacterium]